MSTTAGSSAAEYDDEYDDDDDDGGAEYKMPSMGSLPRETPSRERFMEPSDESTVSLASASSPGLPPSSSTVSWSSLSSKESSTTPWQHPHTPQTPQTEALTSSSGSVPSPPTAALVTPDHHRPPPHSQEALQGSHQSFDITVSRNDEPVRGGFDANYASTDTFPTSNVQPPQPVGKPPVQKPPFGDPIYPQRRDQQQQQLQQQRDGIAARHQNSTNTLPVSNITSRPSTMTEGSATASDITTTTGGTFGTSNAVVHDIHLGDGGEMDGGDDGYYDDEEDDDEDNDNDDDQQQGELHSIGDENTDIPLAALFAHAQKKVGTSGTGDGTGSPEVDNYNGTGAVAAVPSALDSADDVPDVQLEHDPNSAQDIEFRLGDDDHLSEDVSYDDIDDDDGDTADHVVVAAGAVAGAGAAAATAGTVGTLHDSEKSWEGPPVPPNESRSRGTLSSEGSGLTPEESMEKGILVQPGDRNPSEAPPIAVFTASSSTKPEPPGKLRSLYIFRAAFVTIVLVIVIVSAVTLTRQSNEADDAPGVGTVVTMAPTKVPFPTLTPAPTPISSVTTGPSNPTTTTDPPAGAVSPPVDSPPTGSPTVSGLSPTLLPTPSEALTTDFQTAAVFTGQSQGDRFGTVVSLTGGGDFMAVLSQQGTEPVQTFRQTENGLAWLPMAALPIASSTNSSLVVGGDVDTAKTGDGNAVVAVSTIREVQTYENQNGGWSERGQPLPWADLNGTVVPTVSTTAISLSSDASTLATGHVMEGGDAIIVAVFIFDPSNQEWQQQGDYIVRFRPPSASPFVAMSLALSGDGSVVAIGDWAIASQIEVQSYQMTSGQWTPMGDALTFTWGPVAVALDHTGQKLATAAPAPGTGTVYEWDGNQWGQLGNVFGGGTSVALNGAGLRVLVGDAIFSMATILDYQDSDGWTTTSALTGSILSRFGTSVAISTNGNTVAIGSPLEDESEEDLGQVSIYD